MTTSTTTAAGSARADLADQFAEAVATAEQGGVTWEQIRETFGGLEETRGPALDRASAPRGPWCDSRWKRAEHLTDRDVVRLSPAACKTITAGTISAMQFSQARVAGAWREVLGVMRSYADVEAYLGDSRDDWPEAIRALADEAFDRLTPDYVLVRVYLHEVSKTEVEDALVLVYRCDLVETQELPAYTEHERARA